MTNLGNGRAAQDPDNLVWPRGDDQDRGILRTSIETAKGDSSFITKGGEDNMDD